MTCKYSEQDIALYVEGDLIEPAIEAHLLACGTCRVLVDELRESQSLLKGLRQETVSGAALAEVRSRVLVEVRGVSSRTPWGRRVERWFWLGLRRGYALAGVGLAVAMGVGLWLGAPTPKPSVESDPLPPAAAVPLRKGDNVLVETRPIVPLAKGDGVRGLPRTQGVAHTEVPKQAVPDPGPAPDEPKQLVVKLLTDDPNIVIYWLVDQTGG
ncbi:MAG: hypothetical protein HYU27_00995 [Acidobacteria bacterium]|nr:hypothetical protein [Acidobacteriota bacterium]